jgi:predicted O-linked N-acetylglucosamine transferase (SPINDLY family)
MRILNAVEGSVLFLYSSNAIFKENIQKEAKNRGVELQRIIFGQRLSQEEYLARYQVCDLFLDTTPYNAGTTASDALWAGLPVLTIIGRSFPARYAASLLHAIKLPELITSSQLEYESLAIELAKNPKKLKDIKNKLAYHRENTILFNTSQFTKYLELAYTKIYERYHADLLPENVFIE